MIVSQILAPTKLVHLRSAPVKSTLLRVAILKSLISMLALRKLVESKVLDEKFENRVSSCNAPLVPACLFVGCQFENGPAVTTTASAIGNQTLSKSFPNSNVLRVRNISRSDVIDEQDWKAVSHHIVIAQQIRFLRADIMISDGLSQMIDNLYQIGCRARIDKSSSRNKIGPGMDVFYKV